MSQFHKVSTITSHFRVLFESALDAIVLEFFLRSSDPDQPSEILSLLLGAVGSLIVTLCIRFALVDRTEPFSVLHSLEILFTTLSTCLMILSYNATEPFIIRVFISIWLVVDMCRVFIGSLILFFVHYPMEIPKNIRYNINRVIYVCCSIWSLSIFMTSILTLFYLTPEYQVSWGFVATPLALSKLTWNYIGLMELMMVDLGDVLFLDSSIGSILVILHPLTSIIPVIDVTGLILMSIDFDRFLRGAKFVKCGECIGLGLHGLCLLYSYLDQKRKRSID